MKAISIKQPWATLIATGIRDVENRTWKPKENPGKILITTSSSRFNPDKMYLLWDLLIENEQNMGTLPRNLKELPNSAIIGYVEFESFEERYPSIWSQFDETGEITMYNWVVKDCNLFKEPILGIKSKLHIFDIPEIDENNLPEIIDYPMPSREGTTLYYPLAKDLFEQFSKKSEGEIFAVNLLGLVTEFIIDVEAEEFTMLPTEKIVFSCEGKTLEVAVKESFVETQFEEGTDNPIIMTDYFGDKYYWNIAGYVIG